MTGTLDRLMQIQSKAAEPDTNRQESTRTYGEMMLAEQKEGIIKALAAGSTTGALTLALQAVGAGDAAFLEKAAKYMKPAAPGEAWRMAYRTFERHAEQIARAAAQSDPVEAALPVFQSAARECAAIYNVGGIAAQELAMAVYSCISRSFSENGLK